METIEYHANCPSCGAASDGTGVCGYCGASLLKSKVITETSEPAEDVMAREDANLPVITARSGEVSSFLKLFCPLFGGIFIAVPTAVFSMFLAVGLFEFWLIPFFGLFWVIGLGAFVPLFRAMSARKRCLNGHRVTGLVRGYADDDVLINGSPAKILRVRIEEGGSKIVEIKTGEARCRYAVGTKVTLLTDGICYLVEGVAQ